MVEQVNRDELRTLANIDSERVVLGLIMRDHTRYATAAAIVSVDDFSTDYHRRLWRAFAEHAPRGPIDVYMLAGESKPDTAFASYAVDLTDGLAAAINIEHHARAVARCAVQRRFANHCEALKRQACEPNADFRELESRAAEVLAELQKATRPAQNSTGALFVPARQFLATTPEKVDWMIEGVIQSGANGFVCAVPKGGKSWAVVDMALSLALGCDWLGFHVPRAVKTALISREDNPALTGWRIAHLLKAKPETGNRLSTINANLYVNSRAQSPELMLDCPAQVAELTDALKRRGIEFAIFDVFNVMHAADENDNSEMREVLRQLSSIQAAVGCGIGVVHHYSKSDQGSMTQRLRGASAIAGWAEWLIGISIADEESKTRRMDFELKAAEPPNSVHYQIQNGPDGSVRMELTDAPILHRGRREGSAAEKLM